MSFTILFAPDAAREVQAARVWLYDHRVLLRRSRYLLYYRAYRETRTIVVMRIRHERQRPEG